MSKYNFESLGWYGFEQLIRSLLRVVIGKSISSFSGSSDKARDATFSGRADFPSEKHGWDGDWIFQVKFKQWGTQGIENVKKTLKRDFHGEVKKVISKYHHKCDNYVFITNCPLTSADKDGFNISLASEEISNKYVMGSKDIEELLDLNPNIVQIFPQMMGITQLLNLMNWGVTQRSRQYIEQVHEDLQLYVPTNSYFDSLKVLKEQHFCILTGLPKMGKTFTAAAIAASYYAKKFEIVEVRKQSDIYDNISPDQEQLFICDDVFGDIILNADKKDDWTRKIISLLKALGPGRKLLWTTRTYIFNEAVEASRLKEEHPAIDSQCVTVEIDSLTNLEKAQILYKHVKFSRLNENVKEAIRENCVYISKMNNFSPEAIRQISTGNILKFSDDESNLQVVKKICDFFNSPGQSLRTLYSSFSMHEKEIISLLMVSGGSLSECELLREFTAEITGLDDVSGFFFDFVKKQDGTLLKRKISPLGEKNISFYHPSIRDFMIEIISEDVSTRHIYIRRVKIQEVPTLLGISNSVVRPYTVRRKESSESHKLKLNNDADIDIFLKHFRDNVLPAANIQELSVLSREVVSNIKSNDYYRKSRLFLSVVKLLAEYIMSYGFWEKNKNESIHYWISVIKLLPDLMKYSDIDHLPFLKQILCDFSDKDENIVYWEIVEQLKYISNVVVDKYINFENRTKCYDLIISMANGLVDEELSVSSNMTDDEWSHVEDWHAVAEETIDEYSKFCEIFPDDQEHDGLIEDLEQKTTEIPKDRSEFMEDAYYEDYYEMSGEHERDIGDARLSYTEDDEIRDMFNDLD